MRSKKTASPFAFFDSLESRRLMATISVATYGAKPGDGVDDAAAIQRALNAAGSGDTVYFPGGKTTQDANGNDVVGAYNVKSYVTITANKKIIGDGEKSIIQGQSSEGQVFYVNGDNVSITKMTFNGGGIKLDRRSGYNTGITIDHNIFELNNTGINCSGITFTSGLASSVISNNYFTGYTGGYAIYGYNYSGLTIHNNEIINTTGGIHIDAFGNCNNLLVQANYVSGDAHMGFEFQDEATDLQFLDNWFENPNLSKTSSVNDNAMAFSLPLDKSSNVTVARNVVISPQRPDGIGTRISFELGGDNTNVYDNYINGGNQVAAANDGVGTESVTFHDNYMANYLQGPGITFPSSNPSRTFTQYNNGPDVKLTWDLSRGHPGIDGVYGEDDLPDVPVDNPIKVDIKAPKQLQAQKQTATSILLRWHAGDTDQLGYAIEMSTNGAAYRELTLLNAKVVQYLVAGLKPGNSYQFRIRSFNAAGYSGYSNVAAASLGGSTTTPTGTPVGVTSGGSGGTTGAPTGGGGFTTAAKMSTLVLK